MVTLTLRASLPVAVIEPRGVQGHGRRRRPDTGVTDADVVVAGAGLAGLACAFELATAGREVLVLEAREVVGGRTSSWDDHGMAVESGLHRMLGVYRAMPNLLERAGVSMDELVCWEDEVEVRLPDGGPDAVFGAAPLHNPVTTLVGLAANNHLLSPVDKVRLATFAAAGLRDSLLRPGWLDRRSVAEYARADGLPGRVVERLLVPLTAGLFFLPPERYSALVLFGLLAQTVRRLPRLRIGAFTGPMTEVLAAPLAAAVERAGGQVRTGTPVERLLVSAGRVRGVRAGGERLRAGHVVLATMEGAVVSGRRAARVVLEAVTGAAVLAADPPAELVLVACFGPVGAAEVRIRVDRSGAGSLVTMEERPVSGPLGALRSARLLDLAIHVRNAESLRRLRRLARRQSGTSTGRDS